MMVLVYVDDGSPTKFLSADKYSIDDAGLLHIRKGEKVVASYAKWQGVVIAEEKTVLKTA